MYYITARVDEVSIRRAFVLGIPPEQVETIGWTPKGRTWYDGKQPEEDAGFDNEPSFWNRITSGDWSQSPSLPAVAYREGNEIIGPFRVTCHDTPETIAKRMKETA